MVKFTSPYTTIEVTVADETYTKTVPIITTEYDLKKCKSCSECIEVEASPEVLDAIRVDDRFTEVVDD